MIYKEKKLNLSESLNFWQALEQEKGRFFWSEQAGDFCVIAGGLVESDADAPYQIYSQDFFAKAGELQTFKHYFVSKNGEQTYYYLGEPLDIQEREIKQVRHDFAELPSDYADWQRLFDKIQATISSGKAEKIVASREICFEAQEDFQIESILKNLIEQNPQAFVYAYELEGGCFLGASPELLVQKRGSEILSYALAGTASRLADPTGNWLLSDPKNRREHAIVVRKIQEKMHARSNKVDASPIQLLSLPKVHHLRTLLTAQDSTDSLADWAQHLHPTPALGGEPTELALQVLRENEGYERGHYAAPLGLIEQNGNGSIIVGIRSATVEGKSLRAYAGCGLVADSDAKSEFEETQVKLKTILEAL